VSSSTFFGDVDQLPVCQEVFAWRTV